MLVQLRPGYEVLYHATEATPALGRSWRRERWATLVAPIARKLKSLLLPQHFVKTVTGLIVPVSSADTPVGYSEIQRTLNSQGVLISHVARVPTMFGQIYVVPDETALKLPKSTIDTVRAHVRTLPFSEAVVRVADVAARLWPVRDDVTAQRRMLEQIVHAPAHLAAYDRVFSRADDDFDGHLLLLNEQQLLVLQRLVLEEATVGSAEWTAASDEALEAAFLGVTTVASEGTAPLHGGQRQLEDWVGFLMQNGSFNAGGQPLYALIRAHRLFVELARNAAAQKHHAAVDFDVWIAERFNLSAEELFAAGFLAQATSVLGQEGPRVRTPGLLPPMNVHLSTTALASKAKNVQTALAAPREFFAAGFSKSKNNPVRLAWEATPFQQRPFVLLDDGRLALTSPRAIYSWLTDGWYYRLLDIAISKGRRDDFTTFVGYLFETYVLEIFQFALPDRDARHGAVHGEQAYRGGQMTSDVAVDYGDDLLLFEVVSSRLPLGVRAEADQAELEEHLKRALVEKIAQLDRVACDILSGTARIPGVDRTRLRRIWPVVITAGDITQTEPLWKWLHEQIPSSTFADQRVQRLQLLTVEDVEIIAGLVFDGEEIIDVIAAKARSDYRELDMVRWLADTRHEDPPRHPELDARWARLNATMEHVLGAQRT